MPVSITNLGLGRVRRTDPSPQATINGTGFSAANNTVFVSGSVAPIVVQGVTQITFDLPAPFSLDLFEVRSIHVPVWVTNNDTGETSTRAYLWIKGDADEVADERLDTAIPGPFEITSLPEAPDRFEARDMHRLTELIEALTVDVEPGNVLAWDGAKLAEPAGLKGGGAGQVLQTDLGEPTRFKWGFKLDMVMRFGGTIPIGVPGFATLVASGSIVNDATLFFGKENWAVEDGTIDLITLAGTSVLGGLLDRVEIVRGGLPAFDSGAGLATVDYQQAVSVAVTKGQKIELRCYVTGGLGSSWAGVGGLRQLVD